MYVNGYDISERIDLKCGYQYEGTLRHVQTINGRMVNNKIYSLLRDEVTP